MKAIIHKCFLKNINKLLNKKKPVSLLVTILDFRFGDRNFCLGFENCLLRYSNFFLVKI